MDKWLSSLFVPGGRGRGGLIAPPSAGRGVGGRRPSGGAIEEKDMIGIAPLMVKSMEMPDANAEQLAALLQESKRPARKQTLRATLPLLVVFPAHFAVEPKVVQVPARLSVAGTIEYLAQLHGGHFSPAGVGLRVGEEYQFDDAFSRSELFPFLDSQKPLQWYEEVITTTPLYWEVIGGASKANALQRSDSFAESPKSSRMPFDVKVVFPSKLGIAPVGVRLRPSMSVTDAEAAVGKAASQKVSRLRLGVPPELQHLPEVNVEIVKLGMRESKDYPHFEHGRVLSDYAELLRALDYLEMC